MKGNLPVHLGIFLILVSLNSTGRCDSLCRRVLPFGGLFPNGPGTAVLEYWREGGPTRFVLDQNYPNPFNSETTIRLTLPAAGWVELSIYDLSGQKVEVLVNGWRPAGDYSVRWDGRDQRGDALASGVYLYRLQTGGEVGARKLLLLK